jgi:hypothetical protein
LIVWNGLFQWLSNIRTRTMNIKNLRIADFFNRLKLSLSPSGMDTSLLSTDVM